VVFAEPGHAEAKALLADVFEQLGYGADNGTWRCEFLSAAMELRTGNFGTPAPTRPSSTKDQHAKLPDLRLHTRATPQ
jgi:alkyl sulfatase BDS1-like metallo-beta-lactamase superfamily hydrolase